MLSGADQSQQLFRWLRHGKLPRAIKVLFARTQQPHRVIPARHDRQDIRRGPDVAAEFDILADQRFAAASQSSGLLTQFVELR